jgi:hypothetical protein
MTHDQEFSEMVTKTLEMVESNFDLSEIDNMDFEDIDYNDYPGYCDAFCSSADYKGVPMTEDQLDILNTKYSDFVHEKIFSYLF